jgi:hypothetical protein
MVALKKGKDCSGAGSEDGQLLASIGAVRSDAHDGSGLRLGCVGWQYSFLVCVCVRTAGVAWTVCRWPVAMSTPNGFLKP